MIKETTNIKKADNLTKADSSKGYLKRMVMGALARTQTGKGEGKMFIKGKVNEWGIFKNRGYWVLFGLCEIIDGLIMVLSLGFICIPLGYKLSAWRMKRAARFSRSEP